MEKVMFRVFVNGKTLYAHEETDECQISTTHPGDKWDWRFLDFLAAASYLQTYLESLDAKNGGNFIVMSIDIVRQ